MSNFDPSKLPNLIGHVIIVTGGHSGLGLATTTELARHGAKVYMASRSRDKVQAAIKLLTTNQPGADVHFLPCDLADLKSVKRSAEEFLRRESKLHVLINNAGVMCVPYGETPQGYEVQFQTNYLGHYLFTRLLLPLLLSTVKISPKGTVRIVNVSSDDHAKLAPKEGIVFSESCKGRRLSRRARYGMSKLANVLHSKELALRYGDEKNGLLALSLHPGIFKSNPTQGPRSGTALNRIIRPLVEFGAPGPEKGCWNTLWCAASPDVKPGDNGGYFVPVGKKGKASADAQDEYLSERLWEWSQMELDDAGFL